MSIPEENGEISGRRIKFTTDPIGWYSNSNWATFVCMCLNQRNRDINYRTCTTVHNDTSSADMNHKVTQTMTLIKHLARILERKDAFVQGYMDVRRQINNGGLMHDTPEAKIQTNISQLDAQEGIFMMEEKEADTLNMDNIGTEILKKAWDDIRHKNQPYSRMGSCRTFLVLGAIHEFDCPKMLLTKF